MNVSIPTSENMRHLAVRTQELQNHPLVQLYIGASQPMLQEFKRQLEEAQLVVKWNSGIFPSVTLDDYRNGRWNKYILCYGKQEEEAIQMGLALLYLCLVELAD